ncbi:hypothetical protein ACFWUW_02425 [Streptomyces sp. NPDC058655]|uniref:hypothetical protein n=1 Tax=Streptomyces sp. NPDC058655 TaxID=3346577 RepID=UPI003649AB9D
MHQTRTTTKLLLGVACAVSAVSGCVNVSPAGVQPAAPSSTGVPPRHEPRGGTVPAPVVVRAPALEALEAAPEPARPADPAPAPRPARSTAHGAPGGPVRPAPPVPDVPEPAPPAEPAAGRPGGGAHHPRPGGEAERERVRRLPVRPADVCALGRRHGRWHPDSPEARICAGAHGG